MTAADPDPSDGSSEADSAAPTEEDVGPDPDTGDVPPLRLRTVTKEYDTGSEVVRALRSVDLRVERGEFLSVVGPSGSGKSTMLNVLGLLDVPTSGEVLLDGQDVTTLTERERTDARKRYVGFVFQQFYLIDSLTAVENVALPTVFDRDRDATGRAERLLDRVGLGDRLDHTPAQLSGGQKQRVAIARSLINDPDVLLADEPTGNLDRATGRTILDEFRRVCDESDVAVVTVTHDPLVSDYADREVELIDGGLGGG